LTSDIKEFVLKTPLQESFLFDSLFIQDLGVRNRSMPRRLVSLFPPPSLPPPLPLGTNALDSGVDVENDKEGTRQPTSFSSSSSPSSELPSSLDVSAPKALLVEDDEARECHFRSTRFQA